MVHIPSLSLITSARILSPLHKSVTPFRSYAPGSANKSARYGKLSHTSCWISPELRSTRRIVGCRLSIRIKTEVDVVVLPLRIVLNESIAFQTRLSAIVSLAKRVSPFSQLPVRNKPGPDHAAVG